MGYQLIETVTVGSGGVSSIEFTGIPQDGVSLQVLFSLRSDVASSSTSLTTLINGSTAALYSERRLVGAGSSSFSSQVSGGSGFITSFVNPGSTATANTFSSGSIYIPNYLSSAAKSVSFDAVGENNATLAYQILSAGLWNSTATVTSLTLDGSGTNFVQYSTASLFKITAD
jgi:hypothetical protein